jgi:hypothetical protein
MLKVVGKFQLSSDPTLLQESGGKMPTGQAAS